MMMQAGNAAARKAIVIVKATSATPTTTKTSLTGLCNSHTSNTNTCRRAMASSAALIADLLPESVKDAVKSSVLDEISRHDSKLWGDENAGNAVGGAGNESNSGHGERGQGYGRSNGKTSNWNGDASTSSLIGPLSSSSNADVDAGEDEDGQRHSMIINQPISPSRLQMLHDPLDNWYLDARPSASPFLPTSPGSSDPFALAKLDLQTLSEGIRRDLIGSDHPVLAKAASYFFQEGHDGGKKIRPMMVLLLSRAMALHSRSSTATDNHNHNHNNNNNHNHATTTDSPHTNQTLDPTQPPDTHHHTHQQRLSTDDQDNSSHCIPTPHPWQRQDLFQAQKRLAEISEMIHTASLFHDDVIDGADTRRGSPSVHKVFGNKTAILAGDYLLARASIFLARLRDVEVVETMSTIIEHLVRGEVMQMKGTISTDERDDGDRNGARLAERRLVQYLQKNFYKTASLMANSCKSAAVLGGYDDRVVSAAYRYGKHLGVAFQLVDDVLDFDGSASVMGKPALADLNAGLATAPVLFAAEMFPEEMTPMMGRKFREEGDVDAAVELVRRSDGIVRTEDLARVHVELAIDAVLELDQNVYRDSLIHLGHKVLGRTH